MHIVWTYSGQSKIFPKVISSLKGNRIEWLAQVSPVTCEFEAMFHDLFDSVRILTVFQFY